MAQFKQATPAGKGKWTALGGGNVLLPPVRGPVKTVLLPVREKPPNVITLPYRSGEMLRPQPLPYRIPEELIRPTYLFGPEGAAIYNGLEQAGESTASALERGVTATQADSLGAAMGSIELAAGLLPLEHLFSLGKTAPEGVEQVVTAILKQAGLSGGGAAVSELGGQLADTFIMGEQSEYNALVRELETQGLEHGDAQARALADYWLRLPGNAARLGTLSGAIDATGALGGRGGAQRERAGGRGQCCCFRGI